MDPDYTKAIIKCYFCAVYSQTTEEDIERSVLVNSAYVTSAAFHLDGAILTFLKENMGTKPTNNKIIILA